MRKPVFRVSDQVQHKPGCTTTEDVWKLEILYKEEEGLYYLCSENKGADQLCGYRTADLHLCFCICKNQVFLMMGLKYFLCMCNSYTAFLLYVKNTLQFLNLWTLENSCTQSIEIKEGGQTIG